MLKNSLSLTFPRGDRGKPTERAGHQSQLARPAPWIRRHWAIVTLLAVVILASGAVGVWRAWFGSSPCGPGLSSAGSPAVCVGLDLDSTPMRSKDPLADLEKMIGDRNSPTTGPFATIVVLQNLTPDPSSDSQTLQQARHAVEGAITAVQRANNTAIAGGLQPRLRLLLANFGSGATSWQAAVTAIEKAQPSQHIVAVTGIGQSLDNTRAAAAALSAHGITTIGANVTADNMNLNLAGQQIGDFFRVAPTNSDEVDIAVRYIRQTFPHSKTMLIQDQDPADSYAQTLASAFLKQFGRTPYTESYRSPQGTLTGATRTQYMTQQFALMHSDICAEQPDLIYFAGRGTDLQSFLQALAAGGACPLPRLTLISGDDASNIVGIPLPSGDVQVAVLFTALTSVNEWANPQGSSQPQVVVEEAENYRDFVQAFTVSNSFPAADLDDGSAVMEHDAVLTAAIAVRDDAQAVANPDTVAGSVIHLHCRLVVPGASGFIAIGHDGNPVDKAMPMLRINANGTVTQVSSPHGPAGDIDYATGTC